MAGGQPLTPVLLTVHPAVQRGARQEQIGGNFVIPRD
jgi:hypothetical protein